MDRDLATARVLPFPAVVGQDELKRALRMLAVNPRLGGVLIRGEKGTAKSTAARGLAGLLPPVRVNDGCRFGCPADRPDAWCSECRERGDVAAIERRPAFESLPLGVTEDQLLGALDLERALQRGERRFSPGLLARVNQGVLYVDEVNLLDDHIVDLLLDAAAMGVNVVAREGVAVSHPAEFVLVGTMNPEEGDLRPQLLDRFGLCVQVESLGDPEQRADVVERRLAFEANPAAFREQWRDAEAAVADEIARARALLPDVTADRDWCVTAAALAIELGVDGHRADVLLVQGAATLAALDGRTEIAEQDLEDAAPAVLRHRLRRRPFDEAELTDEQLRETARAVAASRKKKSLTAGGREVETEAPAMGHDRRERSGATAVGQGDTRSDLPPGSAPRGVLSEGLWGGGAPAPDREPDAPAPSHAPPVARGPRGPSRARTRSRAARPRASRRGRYVRAVPARGALRDLAWDATLRTAASFDPAGVSNGSLAVSIDPSGLLRKHRVRRPDRLLLFVVDASGSMAGDLTALARSAAVLALRDAYVARERVAMIAFRAHTAELLFGPTNRVELARRQLDDLPLGGTTPLARGLELAERTLRQAAARDPDGRATMILISDGRANVGSRTGYESVLAEVDAACRALAGRVDLRVLMVDATEPGKDDRPARRIAERLGAERISLANVRRSGADAAVAMRDALRE